MFLFGLLYADLPGLPMVCLIWLLCALLFLALVFAGCRFGAAC